MSSVIPSLRSFLYVREIATIMPFVLLLFPYAVDAPNLGDLFTSVMSTWYVLAIHRDVVMYPHQELERVVTTSSFKAYKNHFVTKKSVNEARDTAVHTGQKDHCGRRDLLAHHLFQQRAVLTDAPGLLGPKLFQVLGTLSLARFELEWAGIHFTNDPPKTRKSMNYDLGEDVTFIELASAVSQMLRLIGLHESLIQRYSAEYLSGPHSDALADTPS